MIEITQEDVHIWYASLDVHEWRLSEVKQVLSPDECERAKRYIKPIHSVRFTVGRVVLREVLSRYTGVSPHALRLVYGSQGKPGLQGTAIDFNLAHSEAHLLIAVTAGQQVGIDIERVLSLPDMEQLSRRFLPVLEMVNQTNDSYTTFFQRWTRNEAFLKATGTGIPGLQKLDKPDLANWTICQIDAPLGYVAALAVHGEVRNIKRMEL